MFGPGYVAQLILADSQTVVIGDYLVAAASGQCAKAANITVTTGAATASAVVSTTPTTSGGRPLNPIIGQALEDVTTSGAADRILVKMFI
jgi:hypothetical protein